MILKKKWVALILILILVFLVSACNSAFAASGSETAPGSSLVAEAAAAKDKIVALLEDLAKVAAVIFIGWAGYIFWGAGGDPQKMSAAKSKLAYFFIALFFIFGAQSIVNTMLDLFGKGP